MNIIKMHNFVYILAPKGSICESAALISFSTSEQDSCFFYC